MNRARMLASHSILPRSWESKEIPDQPIMLVRDCTDALPSLVMPTGTILLPLIGSAGLVVALLFWQPQGAVAYDIPNDVTVLVFFRPEGGQLRLLVRAPLQAMRDIEFPQRGPGYLDLARVDASLRDAATLWISDAMEIYEGGARLPNVRVIEQESGSSRRKRNKPDLVECGARKVDFVGA